MQAVSPQTAVAASGSAQVDAAATFDRPLTLCDTF